MFGLGTPDILLILVVLLVFFGKDRLPELAHSIGKSFRELKAGFENPTDTKTAAKPDVKNTTDEKKST